MAKTKNARNGRLEEAMALLIQNQASFLARVSEMDHVIAGIKERLTSIEAILVEHGRLLAEHSRLLEALPEAVRQKIGFQSPEQQQGSR